jgi:zinc protease
MRHQFDSIHFLISLRKLSRWAAVLLIVAGLPCSCSLLDRNLISSQHLPRHLAWPHDDSDMSPDPDALFGRLDNGLGYIIKENHTPRDRVSMHLLVQVGSLNENAKEQGMAHFLEHMLFNGSVHFAPGEMVKYFQRIGMQFGPDANAHTGFKQTDFDGALLLPEEVAREKKVILAEMRSRDSAQFRTFKARLQFELPGLLIGQRFPIGEAELIEKMDHQMLRNFYATWYRPESMILVIVGDLNPDVAKDLIFERFNDLKSHMPSQSAPAIGAMKHQGIETFYHHEEETGMTQVAIETVVQHGQPLDSTERQKQELVKQLADEMIQNRLDAMVQSSHTTLTAADIGSGYYLRQIKYAQIEADCKPEKWPEALAEIEQALRKALTYGFSPIELHRAKNDFRAQLLKAVQEENTRGSKELVREILADLDNWRVFQSPRQRADMLIPFLETVTLEKIQQALTETWNTDQRLVMVTGNADLSSDSMIPEEQIRSTYLTANSVKVLRPTEKKLAEFPYLPIPASAGAIIHRQRIEQIGIEQVEFSNGFRLNLKPTRFKDNQVLATLSFGCGQVCEPINLPGLSKMTEAVVNESGFGALDRSELEAALSGRLAQTTLDIREDMVTINGQAATSELPLLFQLLHTFIKDPGYREDARQLVLNRFQQEYASLPHTVDGMMQLKGQRFLAGGDRRFGAPDWKQLQQRTLSQMKTWLEGQMSLKTMELAIVGDFNTDKAVELAAHYFGSLQIPERKDKLSMTALQPGPGFPQGQSLTLSVGTDIPKALVVVAFPTEDFWDIRRTRRLTVMAELFSERLREHIRLKLGAAYSPYAFNHSYRAYKGYGMTQIHVQVNPQQTDAVIQEIRHIARDLASEKSKADEFRRVLDPTLTYIKDLRQTNTYWLNSVLTGASRYPQQLDWSRTLEEDYAAISAEEIAALARRYLSQNKAAVIILSPVLHKK